MRVGVFVGVILGLYALQTALFASLSLWGVRPDLVLLVVCVIALHRGVAEGAGAGFFAGLLIDLIEGHFIGLGALSKAVAGATVGWFGQGLFGGNAWVPVLMLLVASVTEHTCYLLGLWAFGFPYPFVDGLVHIILPSAWYDALVGTILFPVVAGWTRKWIGGASEHDVGSAEA